MALPMPIDAMLARYRDMQAKRPTDWGTDWSLNAADAALALPCWLPVPLAAHLMWRPELQAVISGAITLADAIRSSIGDADIQGLATVRIGPGEISRPAPQSLPWRIAGRPADIDLLVLSSIGRVATIDLAGRVEEVAAGGGQMLAMRVGDPYPGRIDVLVDGTSVAVARVAAAASLRLHAPGPVRWSVVDEAGGAWFPAEVPRKWDSHGRPFFHGTECIVEVPTGRIHISATNGVGSMPVQHVVEAAPGAATDVSLEPGRRFDPRADGWFSADLHAHANLSGDLVITPDQARCMQLGEDLDLLHLVASNLHHELVYDREAFEATVGEDLPGSEDGPVTRFGVEYRNDLLGHLHAIGLESAPPRYQTGHVAVAGQEDWPPNASVITDLHERGALVGYCHPVWSPLDPLDPVEPFIGEPRSVEARELVADVALGLVDSIELVSNANPDGTIALYHRLLDCGFRLAAVAGTDVFLSISHGFNSDPPGWARVYAQLDGEPPSVAAFMSAIRRGATLATNGPWVTLDVAGYGPGSVVDLHAGTGVLQARATAVGPGVRAVRLVGPGGVLAEWSRGSADGDTLAVELELAVAGPSWVAAQVIGEPHPEVLQHAAVAHTTPVYIDQAGERVASASSARWCLRWLDHLEELADTHGRFREEVHRRDLDTVIDQARSVYRAVEQRALSRGGDPA